MINRTRTPCAYVSYLLLTSYVPLYDGTLAIHDSVLPGNTAKHRNVYVESKGVLIAHLRLPKFMVLSRHNFTIFRDRSPILQQTINLQGVTSIKAKNIFVEIINPISWSTMMFAVASRTFASRIAPRTAANLSGVRGMASLASHHNPRDPGTFKDNFLSESGVYPLIGVLSVALSFGGFVMFKSLTNNPDVRINRKGRSEIIRG